MSLTFSSVTFLQKLVSLPYLWNTEHVTWFAHEIHKELGSHLTYMDRGDSYWPHQLFIMRQTQGLLFGSSQQLWEMMLIPLTCLLLFVSLLILILSRQDETMMRTQKADLCEEHFWEMAFGWSCVGKCKQTVWYIFHINIKEKGRGSCNLHNNNNFRLLSII